MVSNPAIHLIYKFVEMGWYENIERPFAYLNVSSYNELLAAGNSLLLVRENKVA